MPPTAALQIEHLQVRYPGRERPAVDDCTWSAAPGQVTALLGPNGAGKTSTVECCVGLRRPTAGTIRVLGRPGAPAGAEERAQVAVMLQDGGLPTGVRPLALLRHLATLYPEPLAVPDLAERLGITEFARTPVRRLSGGQRQRLALAAALVGRPRLLFLDEPTAGLDTAGRFLIRQVLGEQVAAGVAVVLTTHDLDEAARVSDRAVVLSAGQVVADDSPGALSQLLPRTLDVGLPEGLAAADLQAGLPALGLQPAGPDRVSVRGEGVGLAELHAVTGWFADHGSEPTDLQLRASSLEEAVVYLTGGHR